MAEPSIILEIIGEGKTDIGEIKRADRVQPEPPTFGVVPILVHKLCGSPASLRVIRRPLAFLTTGKTLKSKVKFAKRQAYYNGSNGAVFVVDTEGEPPDRKREEISAGRDSELPGFPMAIGVAHACIETWLLADAQAIARGMKLASPPPVPADPETLPAPRKDGPGRMRRSDGIGLLPRQRDDR